ncbi:MAG: DNA polymerase I [Prevotellaceae bacterium]|jgi:DNA polymerase-1|nr:DNA polymerase I [Prevotellaceae bacterium]
MKKLLLVDAYALIYRAYYALMRSPRINSKGLNTSAIFGFVNTLDEVIRNQQPTHIAVAFDPPGPTFRHQAYEQYKAQREATPENIRIAAPYIKTIVAAMNITILEVAGYEADDVIGTVAKIAEKQDFEVYMLTPDKDYGQLVSEHIYMYRPRHGGGYETMDIEAVKRKLNIEHQTQVIDLLGLMGDASDNIPGCPGVGQKTAAKLLRTFGNIDNLLKNTDKLTGALQKNVEQNREQIEFSRFLATIKTDVPVDFNEKELERKPVNENDLLSIYNELEFRTLISKLTADKPAPTKPAAQTSLFDIPTTTSAPPRSSGKQASANIAEAVTATGDFPLAEGLKAINSVPHNYILVDTKIKRAELISHLLLQKSVCFDTETTGTDVFRAQLVGLSFCWKAGEAFYVNLPDNQQNTHEILQEFRAFFRNENIEKVGQNIKFDLLILAQYGIVLKGKMFDTMIAHYLIAPEQRHGMDLLAEIYLKYKTIHYSELFESKAKDKDIRNVDLNLLKDYAAEDADITFQLKGILESQISENKLDKLFYEIEMPLVRVLATMESNGVRIDSAALTESSKILTAEMNALSDEIQQIAGEKFNVSSPKQAGEILFNKLKIDEKAKRTKTGQYVTSEDYLEKLQHRHPIVSKILEYRGLKKLLSTYIDALPILVNERTGKIHTSYNQTVTSTGRLSSSNPNLQNIPVRDAQGKEIRKAFIPDDNSVFLSADYSQIELRIMAHLSGDENMLEAFRSGQDIHAATAAKIFHIPVNEVNSDMRRKAKTANFGIIYGISAFGLADRLNIPRSEARELIDGYFRTFPQVKLYMEKSIQNAKNQGFVETISGRKSQLADINSANSIVRGYAERFAINAPIQGSAADIIKIAMINIEKQIEKQQLNAKMIMQVHDELNFTVPSSEIETAKNIIVEEMQNAVTLNVPLIVDCGIGNNWLEAH